MTKTGTDAALGCDYVNTFFHQLLLSKVEEDIEVWRKFLESVTSNTTEISKLLRFITNEKLQLTKLEIKLITKKLQDPAVSNSIRTDLLSRFIDNPA